MVVLWEIDKKSQVSYTSGNKLKITKSVLILFIYLVTKDLKR